MRVRFRKKIALAERDDYRCPHCKIAITKSNLSIDHIIPISAGGSWHESNLQILCIRCNLAKLSYPDKYRCGSIKKDQKSQELYQQWAEKHGVLEKWPLSMVLKSKIEE